MKRKICVICLVLILLVSGCGTLKHGSTQEVVVTSNPPGAKITNEDYTCWIRTPGIMKLKRANSTILTARLFKYETQKRKLQVHLSPWLAAGSGLGGWYAIGIFTEVHNPLRLVLVMGDIFTGSVGYLSPAKVHFELVSK